MKGTEKIIAHIESDAQAQAQALLDEANKKAEEIRSAGEKAAQEAYDRLIREGEAECEVLYGRKLRMAEMEAKKNILGAKQERVVETFAKAVSLLCELPGTNMLLCSPKWQPKCRRPARRRCTSAKTIKTNTDSV